MVLWTHLMNGFFFSFILKPYKMSPENTFNYLFSINIVAINFLHTYNKKAKYIILIPQWRYLPLVNAKCNSAYLPRKDLQGNTSWALKSLGCSGSGILKYAPYIDGLWTLLKAGNPIFIFSVTLRNPGAFFVDSRVFLKEWRMAASNSKNKTSRLSVRRSAT